MSKTVSDWSKVMQVVFNELFRITKLDGFNARIAQHEIDHLNGILFIDRVE